MAFQAYKLVAFSLLTCSISASALQARNNVNTTALVELPSCVATCGIQILPTFQCTPEEACYCETQSRLADALVACLQTTCKSLDEKLVAQKFQADTCGFPIRDNSFTLQVVPYALFGLSTVFLLARILSRLPHLKGAGLWWDDYVILFCYIPTIGSVVAAYYEVAYGSGRDTYTLNAHQVEIFALWFYIPQPLYLAVTYLTKLSLVLLYLRVWDDEQRSTFRTMCWIVAVALVATTIAAVFPTIFSCNPLDYVWKQTTGGQGTCTNTILKVYVFAGINIAFDFIVLLLPIPRLWKLHVGAVAKFGLCAIFLVGFAVTACSFVRIAYVPHLEKSRNVTWDYAFISLWSLIEIYCSMICCCMPATAGLLTRCWRLITRHGPTINTVSSSHGSQAEKQTTKKAYDLDNLELEEGRLTSVRGSVTDTSGYSLSTVVAQTLSSMDTRYSVAPDMRYHDFTNQVFLDVPPPDLSYQDRRQQPREVHPEENYISGRSWLASAGTDSIR